MSPTAQQTTVDPLHSFVAGAFVARTPHPIPLVATTFDVILDAGVAVVTTMRRFRNAEDTSIEATITFPVPVHATLFNLTVRIGERELIARARSKHAARADYEGAVDAGKTAVLHEELLRGVHMLSVAHVPPSAEIEVRSTWALTLTNIDGYATLRIPLTVGDVYGRSGLPDSDDLVHGGRNDTAQLRVECSNGSVTLRDAELIDSRAMVALNQPIDLAVSGWSPRDLYGRAADGRAVTLRIEPAASADGAIDAAILVDHSGSMNERCTSADRTDTKHNAVVRGLRTVARAIRAADTIDLWEFDDALDHVGTTAETKDTQHGEQEKGDSLLTLTSKLRGPRGGTEIGHALEGVISRSRARDILLITDGKSHALDVQALARCGRRICVVLVGEDSLEANVGHLCALTGGEIFVAASNDFTSVLIEALRALRVAYVPPAPIAGPAQHVSTRRGGMLVTASWREAVGSDASVRLDPKEARAVAAVAASLVLPALSTDRAAALAEAEGLVTHLTSLVLVDEAGDIQQTVPATRKIALPSPRTYMARSTAAACAPPPDGMRMRCLAARPYRDDVEILKSARRSRPAEPLSRLPRLIDWNLATKKLQKGDLSDLAPAFVSAIRDTAMDADVVALAGALNLNPVVLVVGMLAYAAREQRTAARISRAIFRDEPPAQVFEVMRKLGLNPDATTTS
jgi:hypothetical protein